MVFGNIATARDTGNGENGKNCWRQTVAYVSNVCLDAADLDYVCGTPVTCPVKKPPPRGVVYPFR